MFRVFQRYLRKQPHLAKRARRWSDGQRVVLQRLGEQVTLHDSRLIKHGATLTELSSRLAVIEAILEIERIELTRVDVDD